MKKKYEKLFLGVSFLLIIFLPRIASIFRWADQKDPPGLPPQYGQYPPPENSIPDPGFSLLYFIVIAAVVLLILIFLAFPKLFGFKKVEHEKSIINGDVNKETKFPGFFWPSVVVVLISWFLMWGQFEFLQSFVHYTFLPLWWGFILVLDGFVYKRKGGHSMILDRPLFMALLIIISIGGWYLYEYLNYFVLGNWYYPDSILTPFGTIILYTLSYSVVWPAIFEWYFLLSTFDSLTRRYANGPSIRFSKTAWVIVFIIGCGLTFLTAFFPHFLFWGLWMGPLLLLSGTMGILGHWTPYRPIRHGNWNPLILSALASFATGLFWEFWNYGSQWLHPNLPTNPNYWRYNVPYVDVIHIFSEMPLLGYFGYIPFGVVCFIILLMVIHFLGLEPELDIDIKNLKLRKSSKKKKRKE